MIYEVEVDLESSVAIRNRRRRKSTGGDVKSDAPGVIQPGTLSKANLADQTLTVDAEVTVQSRVGIPPGIEG